MENKRNIIVLTVLLNFFLFLSVYSQAPVFKTHIPSDAGGTEGICVKIIPPPVQRFPGGAPVAVYVEGGTKGDGLDGTGLKLELEGFVEIYFNFPGSGRLEDASGGEYDLRGPECLKALRDVIKFASGELADNSGKNLSDFLKKVDPDYSNVGLIGLSNGGNAAIAAAGMFGDQLSSLSWIVNYESPVGDGMPTCDAGSNGSSTNPSVNPAYNTETGEFDLSLIAWDDTVSINKNHSFVNLCEMHGGLYFDVNKNGVVDEGTDFILVPFVYQIGSDYKAFYSVRIMQEAVGRNLIPSTPPSHIPTLSQTEEFWFYRNGENWIEQAVQKIPDLIFIVEASETDHAQSAPDHPHVLIQYQGFCDAGCRFVRLNPDRTYVEKILGFSASDAADNDAFACFTHQSVITGLQPTRAGGYPIAVTVKAAACEAADRTYYNNTDYQIDEVISSVDQTGSIPNTIQLFQNYPNPFNPSTTFKFTLSRKSQVELNVCNLLGQKVAVLREGIFNEGEYSVVWNPQGVSSGVYIVRLKAGTQIFTRKVIYSR